MSPADADTREISSIITAMVSDPPPAPPNSSGYPTAISSFSTKSLWMSQGNSSCSSISAARGATFSSHSSRTAFRNVSSSSGRENGRSLTGALLRSGRPADDQGVALAAPAAEGRPPEIHVPAAHLVGQGQHQSGSGHPDGVTHRHRAPVDVHDLLIEAEHPARMEGDRRERFVDLRET